MSGAFTDIEVARVRMTRQKKIRRWVETVFHYLMPDVMGRQERARRFFEEAGELAQAAGMTEDEAIAMVRYTWARPVGDVRQEVGGVMVCLYGLAETYGIDVDFEERHEIDRIHAPDFIEKIHAKHQSKIDAGVG